MNILQEADTLVHGARNDDYGHPLDDFSKTAKIWSAILGIDVTPEQVALCMVGVKISRQCNRPKRDNLVDGAGYFATLEMVLAEKARRAAGPPMTAAEALAGMKPGAVKFVDQP